MTLSETIARKDPEFARFAARCENDVHGCGSLDERTCALCVLAALIGLDETDEFASKLDEALNGTLAPAEAREIVFLSAAFCGTPRAKRFLAAAGAVFAARGVALPLPQQDEPSDAERREAGERVQIALFGEEVAAFWQSGSAETLCISRWITENCYGSLYTRGGLSVKERELLTFCFLTALGETGTQLKARVVAGYAAGNGPAEMAAAIAQIMPYTGWPRALSALAALNEADRELNDDGYDDDPF
ncbi:MAG: carboxymuconolactone decarboxylase family protein [Pyramidobacter sp.]|nr:carboxymuconolactone decarboxylase family protein [Pyramidobacter sp.]